MESGSGIPTEHVGRIIADKFRLSECIGIGATGSVYKADQLALGRTVAIKILDPELAKDSRIAKRFHDEALAASRLNHPNTVSIIDFGQTRDGVLYLAMEYLRGKTLTQVLATEPPLSTTRIVDITTQILSGLEEAHLAGVVHADLKADNVVVERRRGRRDRAKVLDFGIARILDTPHPTNAERAIAGTPEYMAPEVISGSQPTFASDVYAVGIMMYEMLTGNTPFTGGTTMEILTRQLRSEPKHPRAAAPDHPFDDKLADITLTALAKRSNDRFPSAALFRKAIESLSLSERPPRSDEVSCQRCGALIAASYKFCPECGESRLTVGAPVTAPAPPAHKEPTPGAATATAPTIEVSGLFPLPMVGRAPELATLDSFTSSSVRGGMIQVVGQRGSGRSRLIGAACARYDPATGEVTPVELFVAVLGASSYTYAEATLSQKSGDFVASHTRALEYTGGVPAALVPDQLKSGVIVACRYEPKTQRTYHEMAQHYGTAIVPARPGKPRDKAKVEVGVQVVQRWIVARLRNEQFFSLQALNERIWELLEDLNARPMKHYGGKSRRDLFELLDKPALTPLPANRFVHASWKAARVNIDYHVEFAKHYYSVPFALARESVEVRATAMTIEVYRKGQRVTSHVRAYNKPGRHTTKPEHMPKAHQAHLEWTPTRLITWAGKIGTHVEVIVRRILDERPHPEQGYRSCLGILRLEKRYGDDRLDAACERALTVGARSYRHIESILKNGLDRLPTEDVAGPAPSLADHENVRGPDYYN